eukprot:TRINITY_DN12878_c0_g1_i7.p1 TRINITY_DN12878_c0_g1~~TRINITY_DN12878_c0_g1_i7.p1  ORF type:complete len:367 (+),score=77.68 TRINITY_DN12878_c0_g1_i7:220-1320(+)
MKLGQLPGTALAVVRSQLNSAQLRVVACTRRRLCECVREHRLQATERGGWSHHEPANLDSCAGSTNELREELYLNPGYLPGAPGERTGYKKVLLIRHGESEAQAARKTGRSRYSSAMRDCGLTRTGWRQAEQLNQLLIASHECDLVVCSSLTRAIQTACLCTYGLDAPIISHPGVAEVGGQIPENQPRKLKELLGDHSMNCLPRFGDIDFGLLANPDPARKSEQDLGLKSFLEFLNTRPETHVFVVCHHNVILKLLQWYNLRGSIHKVPNCVPITCEFDGNKMISAQLPGREIQISNPNSNQSAPIRGLTRLEQLQEKLARKAGKGSSKKLPQSKMSKTARRELQEMQRAEKAAAGEGKQPRRKNR